MNNIHRKFAAQFRTHWIKVKFYSERQQLNSAKRLEDVRFCEATSEAILHPIILDSESITCPGAQYAFGWKDESYVLDHCRDKTSLPEKVFQSMLRQMPRLDKTFECIGLNTDGEPDLIMSQVMPDDVMHLITLYNSRVGKNLDVSLSSVMSICGGIAVRTFLEDRITFSFGCIDSRKYSGISRDQLVVGIPKDQYNLVL